MPIKRPRVAVSPSLHQRRVSSQCLVFAKMRNFVFPRRRSDYVILSLNCISLITQEHLFIHALALELTHLEATCSEPCL